ncbi:GntR family transcriptional regulator [Xanthobacter sp. KR7-65]|uniref:GntR family transcriptional regulator n=1 Tax=Xanthobacter sp. KR7-65 TaxID=3156612 RepID=UPI0032B5CE18
MAKRSKDEIEHVAKRALLSQGVAETLTDAVRQALRRDVLTAALPPGTRLSVRELSEHYGVGATPVREALWSLVGEGLVTTEAQHGFHVAGADRGRLASLLLLRRRVEPWLLGASLRNGGADWRRAVERAFAAFQPIDAQVGDLRPLNEEWERLHQAFHLALIEGSGMPAAVDLARQWYEEIDRYRRLDAGNLSVEAGAKPDHEALFELVTSGAEWDAVETLTRHIDDTAERHGVHFDGADISPSPAR